MLDGKPFLRGAFQLRARRRGACSLFTVLRIAPATLVSASVTSFSARSRPRPRATPSAHWVWGHCVCGVVSSRRIVRFRIRRRQLEAALLSLSAVLEVFRLRPRETERKAAAVGACGAWLALFWRTGHAYGTIWPWMKPMDVDRVVLTYSRSVRRTPRCPKRLETCRAWPWGWAAPEVRGRYGGRTLRDILGPRSLALRARRLVIPSNYWPDLNRV